MKTALTVALWFWAAALGSIIAFDRAVLPNTHLDAQLLGPGTDVATCYGRAARHFPDIEAPATKVAQFMLASGDIDTLIAQPHNRDRGPQSFTARTRSGDERPLSESDAALLRKLYAGFDESSRLYAPQVFTRTIDGVGVVAWPAQSCGTDRSAWLGHLVGIVENPGHLQQTAIAHESTFVFRPANPPESCRQALDEDGVFRCALRLDENWNWTFARYDLERSAARVRLTALRSD
ncbi:MAG: hypothetical protein AAGH41_13485 [Pseudomonadota bacterium]